MNDDRLPIIHAERAIGDTVELPPGRAVGARGPLKEVIRTHGKDDRAQLLTVTIVGWGVHESDLKSDYASPRGPLFAVVEWGIKGARAIAEMDIPAGGRGVLRGRQLPAGVCPVRWAPRRERRPAGPRGPWRG